MPNRLVSQLVLDWQAEAVVQTLRSNITRALVAKCGPGMPADLIFDIQNSENQAELWRWFDAAVRVGSYDEFRDARSSPTPGAMPPGGPPPDDHSGALESALERWNRRAAGQVLEWQAEALRLALLRVLQKRCQAPVPSDLEGIIRITYDLRVLFHWLDIALEFSTCDSFRAATQPQR
jgi:hypothetical protein